MRRLGRSLRQFVRRRRLEKRCLPVLPVEWRSVVQFAFEPVPTVEEQQLEQRIEPFRQQIPQLVGSTPLKSYSSPRSNTFQLDERGHSVVETLADRDVHQLAQTGAPPRTGMLLRRIAQACRAKQVLELGTNTGFSAAWFLSLPELNLVTVEGAASLCEIARQNMQRMSSSYELMNMLFDDAIDELIRHERRFDCVYLDGQHECEATRHYADRIRPLLSENGVIIFDDIYWSEGMLQAWQDVRRQPGLQWTIDLLSKGVVVMGETDSQLATHCDLGDALPRPDIYRKGW